MKDLYDVFHSKTFFHHNIIKEKNFTYRLIISILRKYVRPNMYILDIGCGAGTIDFFFLNRGNQVMGIDVSLRAIRECRKSAKYLGFIKKSKFSVMKFPNEIPTEKFDFIICSEVIEHIENDMLALEKIYSLLKPNGIAFISTPSANAPLYRLKYAEAFDRKVGHLRRYTIESLKKMCVQKGFQIIEIKKEEGILRNFLFINPTAGKLVRFIKYFLSDIITFIDRISVMIFGESDLFLVIKRPR